MGSPGSTSSEIHRESLYCIEQVFGKKCVDFFHAINGAPDVQSIHMHWLQEDFDTNGKLIPVITFSLVEDISEEV